MSGNSDAEAWTIKVPVFRVTDKKWDIWKAQFKAYAHHKKFLGVLLGDDEVKAEREKLTDKGAIRICKANDAAYASLIMACKGGAFGHVNSA